MRDYTRGLVVGVLGGYPMEVEVRDKCGSALGVICMNAEGSKKQRDATTLL